MRHRCGWVTRYMRMLQAHDHCQQPGGEDQVFRTETGLLQARGHRVARYTMHNDQVAGVCPVARAAATVRDRKAFRELHARLRGKRPDVAHFHNTLPQISPAAYYAARGEGVPVIQLSTTTIPSVFAALPLRGGWPRESDRDNANIRACTCTRT